MDSILSFYRVLLLTVTTTYGLICYECDSSASALCSYGSTSFTYPTTKCGSDSSWIPKQCVKIIAKDKDDKEYVARGCFPYLGGACIAIAKTLKFFTSIDGSIKDMNCYTCDGDKCNAATKITGFTSAGLVIAAIAFLFTK